MTPAQRLPHLGDHSEESSMCCQGLKGSMHKEASLEATIIRQGAPTLMETVCPAAGD